MAEDWYTDSEVGSQQEKLNPIKAVEKAMPGGIPSGGKDATYVDAEQLVTFASDILELFTEFSDNLQRGVLTPMTGDGTGNPGAGFVPSSGLLYEGSAFMDKYNYAYRMVQDEFPKHLNGLQALNAVGINAATGYLNGDHDGGRNIDSLVDDAVPKDKRMFDDNGKPTAPPPDTPEGRKQASDKAAIDRTVKDILSAQEQQTKPATDNDGKPTSAPKGPKVAGTPGYHLPSGAEVRGDVQAGGKVNGQGPFNPTDGMVIARDGEGIEIDRKIPK